MSEAVIRLAGIRKCYGKKEVLSDVNLTVEKGDIYGLVGKNGAGKTTIFKLILGLSATSGGSIEIGDPGESISDGRKKIGFLIGTNFYMYLSGRSNITYYARMKGIKDKSEIDRVLGLVGLAGVKGNVKSYSLGMRQRLGIAAAMLGNPEILILDEPANGLDPQGIADIRNLLKKINKEQGTTIIVSSHILGELQHTAHRFGIVNNGTIVKEFTEEDLAKEEQVIRLKVSDVGKAKEILTENGIEILQEEIESQSLENVYFSLVGGGENE